MGQAQALIALGARKGNRVDHEAGKGQGEAWDSMGSECCEAAAGAGGSMQPPAVSQRGPVARAPSRHQQGCHEDRKSVV